MAGEGQGVDIHFLHVDGEGAGRLGAVDKELYAPAAADLADLFYRQKCAADIGSGHHDDGAGVGADQGLYPLGVEGAGRLALGAVKGDALLFHLDKGAHDGVMLHRGCDDMVPGL